MEETYKGYTITLTQDDCGDEDPLDWTTPEERGATFVMYHSRYNLPNEAEVDFDDYDGWKELVNAIVPEGNVYKFVDWYEHSGIAVHLQDSTTPSDMWDSGIVGIIYGPNERDIENAFTTWKQYIEGDVWCYEITDEDGEQVDALGGIFGEDYAFKEARDFIDHYVKPHKVAPNASAYHK